MQLILRVVNTARSAFFAVTFASSFFDLYELYESELVQTAVLLKQVLATFRTPRCETYEWDLSLTDASSYLSIKILAENHMIKSYHLDCLDSEILNATVDKEAYSTCVICEGEIDGDMVLFRSPNDPLLNLAAGELNRLLSSFQSNLAELTIIANPEHLLSLNVPQTACQFQSFIDVDKAKSDESLNTSLSINTRSLFLHYKHKSDQAQDVTLNLKDFRTMLSLCEHLGSNILFRFDCPGSPLVAQPHVHGQIQPVNELQSSFSAELVLATLIESQLGKQMQPDQDQANQYEPAHLPPAPAPSRSAAIPSPPHPGLSSIIPSHLYPAPTSAAARPLAPIQAHETGIGLAGDANNVPREEAMREEEEEADPEALPRSPSAALGSLFLRPQAPHQAQAVINIDVEEDELPGTPVETQEQVPGAGQAGFIC